MSDTKKVETNSQTLDVQSIIEDITPDIRARVAEEMKRQVAGALTYTIQDQVREIAAEFIKAEILPEVQKVMADKRTDLVTGIVAAVETSVQELATHVRNKMVETLGKSWKVDSMIRELLS